MKNTILFVSLLLGMGNFTIKAQNTFTGTGVPFLRIAADAKAAGRGDNGVATTPDVFSQQWNAAKYPFSASDSGIGISYTPYLTALTNDMALLNLNFYTSINDRSTVAIGLRYFGLGETLLRNDENDPGREVKPNELALDGSYALQLSETFSMAVTGRYIRSDLKFQEVDPNGNTANAFAVDIAGFYQSQEMSFKNFQGVWRGGIALSNFGSKLKYYTNSGNATNLPTTLRAGGAFDFIFDEENKVQTSAEFNSLVVKETKGSTASFGIEYLYKNMFALRTGYSNGMENKVDIDYLTFGAGFTINKWVFDLSYLSSLSNYSSPLDNTLRFSLSYGLGSTMPKTNIPNVQ